MTKLQINIVSDIVCPWCVIGYKNLKQAELLINNEIKLDIDWQPYQLHPDIPKNGINRKTFLTKRYGQPRNEKGASDHLKKLGEEVGFKFNFYKNKIIPNTMQAHRLLELVESRVSKSILAENLFDSYFTLGVDIGDKNNLLDIGKKSCINENILKIFLDSDKGMKEVIKKEEEYRNKYLPGVPTFIINDQYIMQGAQEPLTFVAFLKRIRDKVEDRKSLS